MARFKLKKLFKPLTALNPATGLATKWLGGKYLEGTPNMPTGQIYGFQDPNSFKPPTSLPEGQSKRMALKDVLGNIDTGFNPTNTDAIYDEALAAGEAQRAREESRSLENVLGGLQSRGIVKSGVTLRDAADQVIGPAAERARQLAADINLKRAGTKEALDQQRMAGRLQAILGEQTYGGQFDLANMDALQRFELQKLLGAQGLQEMEAANAYGQKAGLEERRAGRQRDLMGLFGNIVGGGVKGLFGGG